MPIFEFQCPDGHLSEVIYLSRPPVIADVPCATCGAPASKVAVSSTNWQIGSRPSGSAMSQAIDRARAAEARELRSGHKPKVL